MNEDTKHYITSLAKNNWEIEPDAIIELLEQLEFEGVIKIKNLTN